MVLVASLILISYFEPELFLQNIRSIVIKRYFGILIIDPLLDLMERLKSLNLTNKPLSLVSLVDIFMAKKYHFPQKCVFLIKNRFSKRWVCFEIHGISIFRRK